MKFVVEESPPIPHPGGVSKGYGQYCPVSLATEILGERWTILVVLALSDGVSRFNDLQRALPRISPSVLASRLRTLEDGGIAIRKRGRNKESAEYFLTEGGEALVPVIYDLGAWGQRWARDLDEDDLDPHFLAWSMHLQLRTDRMPRKRTILEFEFSDTTRVDARFWIVVTDRKADVCIQPPGEAADLRITGDMRCFVEAWRGIRSLQDEIAARRIRVDGSKPLCRAFPSWLKGSALAGFDRERPGRERTLSRRVRARRGERIDGQSGPAR
jgi:DNA-binding HxlR family transcriptional regulator